MKRRPDDQTQAIVVIQHEDDRVQFNYHLYKSVQLSIDRVDQPRHHPI